MHLVQCWA